ncbi:hypothetical protein ACJ72_00809 [Emergomyces africanus]|uniref:Rhodopsin domain-containing protein n=1 Tax=Emergomyces africanus TaxID=1955775 RepID=A0A1B7P7E5_9EURO|nr:hypothetical protein ACJ72_00809 [Emergomyces africanus]
MAPTQQVEALVIITVFPAISLVLVAIRIFARFLSKNWGWDDVFVIIAMVLSIGMSVTSWGYTIYGKRGIPPEYFSSEVFRLDVVGEKYNLANQMLYYPILTFVRASIIIFILRLDGLRKHVIRSLYFLFVLNFGLQIAFFFADLFQCSPIRYIWDSEAMDREAQEAAGAGANGFKDGKLITGGKCIDRKSLFISLAAVSIFLDVWLLCIPSAIVWGINMPRRQKCMVVGVLSIGVLVTGFSIARAIIASKGYDIPYPERTYNIKYTFSNVETNCAIWAAAVPALKSLISRISPRWWQSATAPSSQSPNASNLPHISTMQSPPPPLVGSEKVSRAASSSDPQSYPVGFLAPLRRINRSEVELQRFEHDPRVSSLFRGGQNYIPDDYSSEGTMSALAGGSIGQTSPGTKRNRSSFGLNQNEEGLPLSPSPTSTASVQSVGE